MLRGGAVRLSPLGFTLGAILGGMMASLGKERIAFAERDWHVSFD